MARRAYSSQSRVDTLIVCGGIGTDAARRDGDLISWLARQPSRVERLASVCTGAFLLAEANLPQQTWSILRRVVGDEALAAARDEITAMASETGLYAALLNLPQRQLDVIILRYVLHYSSQKTSWYLGITVSTVDYHLHYLWSPAPHTMLRSVKKLEPGSALRVRRGRVERAWRWWDLPCGLPAEPWSEAEAARRPGNLDPRTYGELRVLTGKRHERLVY